MPFTGLISSGVPVHAGPSRATAGPGKSLSWGPITTSLCMRRDRNTEGVEREETWEGLSPHHPKGVWESVVSSPSGSGVEPWPKMVLCIFEVRNKPSWASFSVLLSDGGPPKCRGAWENFPPFSPLDGPVRMCVQCLLVKPALPVPYKNVTQHLVISVKSKIIYHHFTQFRHSVKPITSAALILAVRTRWNYFGALNFGIFTCWTIHSTLNYHLKIRNPLFCEFAKVAKFAKWRARKNFGFYNRLLWIRWSLVLSKNLQRIAQFIEGSNSLDI